MFNTYEKKILFERLIFTSSKMFTGHSLSTMKFDIIERDVIDALVFELKTEVMTEKLFNRIQKVTFKVPKSWWQHFKQVWFPKWVLRKFPVRFETHTKKVIFERYATYPQLPLVFPKDKIGQIVYKDFVTVKDEKILEE